MVACLLLLGAHVRMSHRESWGNNEKITYKALARHRYNPLAETHTALFSLVE